MRLLIAREQMIPNQRTSKLAKDPREGKFVSSMITITYRSTNTRLSSILKGRDGKKNIGKLERADSALETSSTSSGVKFHPNLQV